MSDSFTDDLQLALYRMATSAVKAALHRRAASALTAEHPCGMQQLSRSMNQYVGAPLSRQIFYWRFLVGYYLAEFARPKMVVSFRLWGGRSRPTLTDNDDK